MTPLLLAHVTAGSIAILSGTTALALRKGARQHRLAGRIFAVSMLVLAVLGMLLAPFATGRGAAPPQASIAVGLLTLYLVTTGWLTLRPDRRFDHPAMLAVFLLALALAGMGLRAMMLHLLAAPYFVFAAIAVLAGLLDARAIQRDVFGGPARIVRHLWRMCVALFFATAFFFIGQQKVMPVSWHGSLLLYLLAFAPLAAMAWWLWRTRRTRISQRPVLSSP